MSERFYGVLKKKPSFDGYSVITKKADNKNEAIEKFNYLLDEKHVCTMCMQKGFDDCKHIRFLILLESFATEKDAVEAIDSLWPFHFHDPKSMLFPDGSEKFHELM